MKRHLLLVATVITLQACKHPLAIIGEGDIVETTGTGRGCTLEQFREDHPACSENEVSDDYQVNYQAVPRPGWRFVRWEGPCSPQSSFQHCSFDVPKAGVDWWDENYPDTATVASTAVFRPITGETGYLVAGAPIVGVTYETPTQQGVTGLDGSFQYAQGELVQFSIGTTILGEVRGRAQLTPFDLAGSPALTGRDLTWQFAARSASLSRVINLAVLLQTLDSDGDPTNGIEITPGVAAMLAGVKLALYTRFDPYEFTPTPFVDQDWEEFQRNPTLRHVIGQANRKQRFSAPHGIVDPGVALKQLYQPLQVDAGMVAVIQQQDDRRGIITDVFTYNPSGRVTAHESTRELIGGFQESWKYNGSGKLAKYRRAGIKVADEEERALQYDSLGNRVQVKARDAFGDWLTFEHSYFYDADGNLARHTEVENRRNEDSGRYDKTTSDSFFYHSYDDAGRLAQWEEDLVITGPDGSEHYNMKQWFEYDSDGNLRKFTRQNRRPDLPENPPSASWREFNKHGKLTVRGFGDSVIERRMYNADGRLKQRQALGTTWQYRYAEDADGRLVLQEEIDTASGEIGETVSWQYDSAGNVIRRERLPHSADSGMEGDSRTLETWQYHANGSVSAYAFDERMNNGEIPALRATRNLQYDTDGNLISHAESFGLEDGEPLPETISRWEYDADGNLVAAEENVTPDEDPASAKTWAYDTEGNITRYTADQNNDGSIDESTSYQYAPVGWGYLVSGFEFTPRVVPPVEEIDEPDSQTP